MEAEEIDAGSERVDLLFGRSSRCRYNLFAACDPDHIGRDSIGIQPTGEKHSGRDERAAAVDAEAEAP